MTPTISRRNFFNLLNPSSVAGVPSAVSGTVPTKHSKFRTLSDPLTPYSGTWDEFAAGHLLRRTMMAPTWSDIEALVALGDPGKAVDLLLNATSTPTAPTLPNEPMGDPGKISNTSLQAQYFGELGSDDNALRIWWINLQINASNSIQEKMVSFWSGHFTSQFDLGGNSYDVAPLLYQQNQLFRSNALGNFQDLVKGVTLDGAMLVFLGGTLSSGANPNENYARELMELFTCGLDRGYTQVDIQAAARILTGWRASLFNDEPDPNGIFQTYFDPSAHDTSDKFYLQTDFPAISPAQNTQDLVRTNEIYKLVDTLFTVNADYISNFISTKLYKFFVYSNPNTSDTTETAVINAMASQFKQDWQIKPIISLLLKSQHFFDNVNIGAQIKTPAEYAIGLARQLGFSSGSVDGAMQADNQEFFQPPNVSGWPGYHDWLTTNTYPARGTQAQGVVSAMTSTQLEPFYKQFPAYNTDVTKLATQIAQLLLPRPLSTARLQTFTQMLAANNQAWVDLVNTDPEEAAKNVQTLLNYIIARPDFELC